VSRRALAAILLLTCLAPACDEKPETPAPDTTPPQVWITAPTDSATIAGVDSIRVTATDDEGVVRVAAYLDADSIGGDLTPPYAIAFNPLRVGADTFALRANAWDVAGNVGEAPAITIFTPAAALAITQPAAEAVLSGTVAVRIEAVRPELIAEVQLLVDGAQVGAAGPVPLTVDWDTEAWSDGGRHLLQAVADVGGFQVVSTPVSVRVSPGSQAIPAVLAPEDDSLALDPDVTLRWKRLRAAAGYGVQLSFSSSFSTLILDAVAADTLFTATVQGTGWCYARVRGDFDDLGWGEWSSVRRFQRGSPLVDGILIAPVASSGEDAALDADGRLMIVGDYGGGALALGLEADLTPYLYKPLFQSEGSGPATRVAPGLPGEWSLVASHSVPAVEGILLRFDDPGGELDRTYLPVGSDYYGSAAFEGDGLANGFDGSSVIAADVDAGTGSAAAFGVDAQGEILWSDVDFGDGDGGHWGYFWYRYWSEGLLTRASGDLLWFEGNEHEEAGFDDQDGGWYNYGIGVSIVSVGSTPRESGRPRLWLPAKSLGGCCEDPTGQLCAVGFHRDDYPALFLIPAALDSSRTVPLNLGTWSSLEFRSIAAYGSGDFIVTGQKGNRAMIFRVIADGSILWLRQPVANSTVDIFNRVLADVHGDLVTVGTTKSPGHNYPALWVMLYDAQGNDITPAGEP